MEVVGMTMGILGFIFALNALNKVSELEKKLKESGALDKDTK